MTLVCPAESPQRADDPQAYEHTSWKLYVEAQSDEAVNQMQKLARLESRLKHHQTASDLKKQKT